MKILAKYHANGDLEDELIRHEYNEICLAIQLEEENCRVGFIDFLKTPGNRRRLLVLLTMATGTVRPTPEPELMATSELIIYRTGSATASFPTISRRFWNWLELPTTLKYVSEILAVFRLRKLSNAVSVSGHQRWPGSLESYPCLYWLVQCGARRPSEAVAALNDGDVGVVRHHNWPFWGLRL